MPLLLALLLAFLVAPAAPAADESPLRVTEMAVCREIVARGCDSEGRAFDAEVETVAFLTKVEGATGEAYVEHVWSFEGKVVRRNRLVIKNKTYRTWSTKRVRGLPGKWRVEVIDPVGRLLGAVDFSVAPPRMEP